MPKLPGKPFSDVRPRDVDVIAVDESDCLMFEQRLNELLDQRYGVGRVLPDAHLLDCNRCQQILEDYQGMLEATKLLSVTHDDNSGIDEDALVAVGSVSSSRRVPAHHARHQLFGWSTLLAVLFVFWGASVDVPMHKSLNEGVSPASLVGGQVEQAEFSSGLSLADLLGDPMDFANHFVGVDSLAQSAPASGQPFFEMTSGRLLAAGLPEFDFSSVEIEQLNHIGRYWQHASRLPGFEPWQHSINFAIGWLNQSSLPSTKPQCG